MSDNLTYKFCCQTCNIKTNNKKDYNNHILTKKHITNENYKNELTHIPEPIIKVYKCNCGNIYKYRQGLYKHKLNCNIITPNIEINNTILINNLLKQNNDIQIKLVELLKNI